MPTAPADTVHATTVAIGPRGVMLFGLSGAGKSDLALRLIDRGAMLVADDRTALRCGDGALLAAPPAALAGMIEVRGIGILRLPYRAPVPVALGVTLAVPPERLPDEDRRTIAGVSLPFVTIDPRAAAAPILVELALAAVARHAGPA